MADTSAPSGWYPDPAGGGGQRYWDGARWTQKVRAKPGLAQAETALRRALSPTTQTVSPARQDAREDRLPDGYMLLNGKRASLGQITATATASSSAWRSYLVTMLVASIIAVVVVLIAMG